MKISIQLVLWGFFKEVREKVNTTRGEACEVYYVHPIRNTSVPGSTDCLPITMMVPSLKRLQEKGDKVVPKKPCVSDTHYTSVGSNPLLEHPIRKETSLAVLAQLNKLTKCLAKTASIVKQDGTKVKCKFELNYMSNLPLLSKT